MKNFQSKGTRAFQGKSKKSSSSIEKGQQENKYPLPKKNMNKKKKTYGKYGGSRESNQKKRN